MSKHKWSQKAFTDGGTYKGFTTCLNLWGCKTCNLEIELPLGVNPDQYDHTICKGVNDNVYRSDPKPVYGLQKDDRVPLDNGHPRNRHEVRKLRSGA